MRGVRVTGNGGGKGEIDDEAETGDETEGVGEAERVGEGSKTEGVGEGGEETSMATLELPGDTEDVSSNMSASSSCVGDGGGDGDGGGETSMPMKGTTAVPPLL